MSTEHENDQLPPQGVLRCVYITSGPECVTSFVRSQPPAAQSDNATVERKRRAMHHKLIAEYAPSSRPRLLLHGVWGEIIFFIAFALYRFFTVGDLALAELSFCGVACAVLVVTTYAGYLLKRRPTIYLYENGVAIDGSFFLWPEIQNVRYRRFENFWNRRECEWRIQANDRQYRFSVTEPNVYIRRAQLNSAFVKHVKDFRDESRLI